jgi:hypothetical protein
MTSEAGLAEAAGEGDGEAGGGDPAGARWQPIAATAVSANRTVPGRFKARVSTRS